MQVDPFVSLLVGALGAAALGLFGAWIQFRREHSRWIREQRMEATRAFLRVAERMPSTNQVAKYNSALDEMHEALAAVRLFGPPAVIDAALTYRQAAFDRAIVIGHARSEPELADPKNRQDAEDKYESARDALIIAARRQLGVK